MNCTCACHRGQPGPCDCCAMRGVRMYSNEPKVLRSGLPDPSGKLKQAEEDARQIAHIIGQVCPAGWGFAFLMMDFSGPEMTWISNAQRGDMVKLLRELADRLERGEAGGPVLPSRN